MKERRAYSSDVTDEEWSILEPLIPAAKSRGRPITHVRREIVNAIFYLSRSGCSWRELPHDFPAWQTVSYYYYEWCKAGIWTQIVDALRVQVRIKAGRQGEPSAAILDSQSVKTCQHVPASGQSAPGYDAGKKIKGRKRHILVDTMGLLLLVVVHSAGIQDRAGAKLVCEKARGRFPNLKLIWADGGYAGKLVNWVLEQCQWVLEIVKRNADLKGFQLLPRRWVVERTLGWLGRYRRLSKDYEYSTESSAAMVEIAMIQVMLHRLCREPVRLRKASLAKEKNKTEMGRGKEESLVLAS